MSTRIVNHQCITDLADGQRSIYGEFIVILTEAADNIHNLCLTLRSIHIGNVVIRAIHSRTQQINRRGIHSQIGSVGLLLVGNIGDKQAIRRQHKAAQLRINLDLS